MTAESPFAPVASNQIADSDIITEGKADFLLLEAKEQLAATVADAEALNKTGVYLLGGLLTVTSALVGVTASQFTAARPLLDQRWGTIVPLLLTTVYAAVDAAIIMWTALSCKLLEHGGNTPSNLATNTMFQLELRLIKFSEAMSYQVRIESNLRRNEQVGVTINLGIKVACLSPLIYLCAFLAMYFIAPSSFHP
jgi:hypothetical protein